jgi:hypothetical protein
MKSSTVATAFIVLAAPMAGCRSSSNEPEKASAKPQGPTPSTPMNVTPLPAASIDAVVNPKHLPPYTGPTGSVEGTIRIDGPAAREVPGQDFTKCPDGERMYGREFREGPPQADGSRALPDAVVGVTGYTGFYVPERNEAQTLTIDDCAFAARSVAMTFGQRLEVANKTKELWAPSLVQAPMPVLMFATSNGDPVKLYPPKPGYFTLIDKGAHPWAVANVYAMLQPLHAVSDSNGHYRIDGVPVGKLYVSAHLQQLQLDVSSQADILEGVVAKVDLVMHNPVVQVGMADAGPRPHVIP